MTDPLHDDAVSRRYRELPPEEPPHAVDEAILAASRRAAYARPAPLVAPTGRQRWYVPLAAAAVIVLAAGLGLHLQLERPDVEDVTPPSPTVLKAPQPKEQAKPEVAERKPDVAQAAPASPADKQTKAPPAQNRIRQKAEESAEPVQPQSRDDAPQPFKDESLARTAPAAPAPPDTARAESRAMSVPRPQAMRAPAPAAAPPAAGARADVAQDHAEQSAASGAVAKRAVEETPEKVLERIAELRKAGKDDEADKALAEFRKRFPDYKLSDEMKAKVERR